MKKRKIDTKFIRNIIIGVILLLIVAKIINVAPGYKRDKYGNVTNLIINEENVTEELKHKIYINENKDIYISQEDIKNLFDLNLYYDEQYNQIITTSDTKVASISLNEKTININGNEIQLKKDILKIDGEIYLPISELNTVYNMNVVYIKNTNRVVVDELSKGIIKATVEKQTDIKFKPRRLSKVIGKLQEGEFVDCFYTTSMGWSQIRTKDGIIGYVKANKLTNEYILRQDMIQKDKAEKISEKEYKNKEFKIKQNNDEKNIKIKELFTIDENGITLNEDFTSDEKYKTWVIISNNGFEKQIDDILSDYKKRTLFIDSILDKTIQNEINGIILDFKNVSNKDMMQRFVIEIKPKLKELGISTIVVLNNLSEKDYIEIVDYIVK